MKKMFFLTAVLVAGLPPFCVGGEKIDVKVKGMVCSFCAQGLDKKFKAEPSVEKVKISLKTKNVHLELKDDQKLPDENIRQIVDWAGYEVESIQRKE